MTQHGKSALDVIALSPHDLVHCRRLIADYPHKPFYYYPLFSNAALTDYMLDELTDVVQKNSSWCYGVKVDDHVQGLVVCGKRAWETSVLGMEAGFIGPLIVDERNAHSNQLRHALLAQALACLAHAEIVQVTARLDVNDIALLHLLEAMGFITLDGILHFSLDLRHGTGFRVEGDQQGVIYCRLHRETDIPVLCNIAARAYSHDRFHSDPVIDPAVADRAYACWIENACHGLDDAVMVAIHEDEPVGFMTLKISPRTKKYLGATVGKIWLVAVAEHMRSQRVGQQLMHHSLQWFSQHGVDIVEVGTQLRNAPGLRFYSRVGFVPINPVFALRKVV